MLTTAVMPGFASFVERAGVTMLGVVPSLVRAWRESDACIDADGCRALCELSEGAPGRIGVLADNALYEGWLAGSPAVGRPGGGPAPARS